MIPSKHLEPKKSEKPRAKKALFAETPKVGLAKKSFTKKRVDAPCTMKHPDHSPALTRLRRIQGQISGIEKMVMDRRYCVDILTQFRAVSSALKAAEGLIFEKHLQSCVEEAFLSQDKTKTEEKMGELMKLLYR